MLFVLIATLVSQAGTSAQAIRFTGPARGVGPFHIGMANAEVRAAARPIGRLTTELETGEGGDQWTVYVLRSPAGERLLVFTFEGPDIDEKTGAAKPAEPAAPLQSIRIVSPWFRDAAGIGVGLSLQEVARLAGRGAFHGYEDSTAAAEFDRFPQAQFDTSPSLWQLVGDKYEEMRKKYPGGIPLNVARSPVKVKSILLF